MHWCAIDAMDRCSRNPRVPRGFPESNSQLKLSLARAGDRTLTVTAVGSNAVAIGMAGDGDAGKRSVLHLNQSLAASVSARSSSLGSLLVGDKVERDKENQVRGENAHSGEGCKLLASASSVVGGPWEVGAREVGVRRKVDEP